jgi:CheY-like chemotaxis protein
MGSARSINNRAAHNPGSGNATILVVEDEVLLRAMVTDVLRGQGYSVVEAANADEAVSILHSNLRVDLLLTDVRMPGSLNGMGLARLVHTKYPFVKVVMVSGQTPDAEFGDMSDGFFPKPYDFSKLIGHIKILLG